MSWLFSRALVEEYSEATSWDGEPSAPLSVMPTQHKFWRFDKTMEPSQLSRFGLTCAVLTEDRGEDLLTWFRQDSHAKTSVSREKAPESTEAGLDYGIRRRELLAKFDPRMSSWKIVQPSLLGDSEEFLGTWPRWGMTVSGVAYRQNPLVLHIRGIESGSLLPTPTKHNAKEGAYPAEYTRNTPTLATYAGGRINPEWTEWLMGWPFRWTDLRPLEMDKFHEWQQQHSISFQEDD